MIIKTNNHTFIIIKAHRRRGVIFINIWLVLLFTFVKHKDVIIYMNYVFTSVKGYLFL